MKTQIKEWGNSKVIILPPDYLNFHDFKVGEWLDISDIKKVKEVKRKWEK